MTLPANILPAAAANDPGILFVAILGIVTVMLGLVCIILLCMLMSRACQLLEKKKTASPTPAISEPPSAIGSAPGHTELVAAITAAVAEELGTDVSAIRVHSLRKIR